MEHHTLGWKGLKLSHLHSRWYMFKWISFFKLFFQFSFSPAPSRYVPGFFVMDCLRFVGVVILIWKGRWQYVYLSWQRWKLKPNVLCHVLRSALDSQRKLDDDVGHRFPKIDCNGRGQLIDSNSMRCTSSSWRSCKGHFPNCWLPSCHILFRSKVLAWGDAYSCHNTVSPRSLQ